MKARLTNAKGDKVYAETALNAKVGKGMGNLLESVGITPDYLLDEMTGEEKEKLYQNDPTAADRGLKKAMEVLK